mgnify:CR=1 FL=1
MKEKFEDASTLQNLWMPDQVSTIAPEVDSLFYFILYWVYFFLAIVVVGAIYFGWKYKSNVKCQSSI